VRLESPKKKRYRVCRRTRVAAILSKWLRRQLVNTAAGSRLLSYARQQCIGVFEIRQAAKGRDARGRAIACQTLLWAFGR
jgi:hypothetical protein